MFENLRNAFREAIENFQEELKRDRVPESVDRLIAGMRDEVAEAKVRLRELEDQIARAQAELREEEQQAATARRRGDMAHRIGDEETAEVARRFLEKHSARVEVLGGKVTALQRELAVRRAEISEMIEEVKRAQARRDSLAATAGRAEARETLRSADDLFGELDRMAEKIGDEEARAGAAEDLGAFDLHVDPDAPPRRPEVDVDSRLEELKRRMGRD